MSVYISTRLFMYVCLLIQIGTLDALIVINEELEKVDGQFESIVYKTVDALRTVLDRDEKKISQQLQVNEGINWFWRWSVFVFVFVFFCFLFLFLFFVFYFFFLGFWVSNLSKALWMSIYGSSSGIQGGTG